MKLAIVQYSHTHTVLTHTHSTHNFRLSVFCEAAKLVVGSEEGDKGRVTAEVGVASDGPQQVLHSLHLLLGP